MYGVDKGLQNLILRNANREQFDVYIAKKKLKTIFDDYYTKATKGYISLSDIIAYTEPL